MKITNLKQLLLYFVLYFLEITSIYGSVNPENNSEKNALWDRAKSRFIHAVKLENSKMVESLLSWPEFEPLFFAQQMTVPLLDYMCSSYKFFTEKHLRALSCQGETDPTKATVVIPVVPKSVVPKLKLHPSNVLRETGTRSVFPRFGNCGSSHYRGIPLSSKFASTRNIHDRTQPQTQQKKLILKSQSDPCNNAKTTALIYAIILNRPEIAEQIAYSCIEFYSREENAIPGCCPFFDITDEFGNTATYYAKQNPELMTNVLEILREYSCQQLEEECDC